MFDRIHQYIHLGLEIPFWKKFHKFYFFNRCWTIQVIYLFLSEVLLVYVFKGICPVSFKLSNFFGIKLSLIDYYHYHFNICRVSSVVICFLSGIVICILSFSHFLISLVYQFYWPFQKIRLVSLLFSFFISLISPLIFIIPVSCLLWA